MGAIERLVSDLGRIILVTVRKVAPPLIASLVSVSLVVTSIAFRASPAWADQDKRIALVIGNSVYGDGVPALANPMNDSEDIAAALKSLNFDVRLYKDLNEDGFRKALRDFAREASSANTALFYYAGHAMHFDEESYLIPVDVKVEDKASVRFNMISVEDDVIKKALADVPLKILILDACRDNPIAKQIVAMSSKSRSIGDVRGLARISPAMQSGQGMLIAYATGANQVAADGQGRNSPFSGSLKKHMKESGIEIRSMLKEVETDVRRETNQLQQPEITASLPGNFFLNPGESDESAWAIVKDSSDVNPLKDFIRRFPKSSFVGSAMDKIKIIQFGETIKQLQEQAARQDEAARKAEDAQKQADAAEKALRQEAEQRKAAALLEAQHEEEIRKQAEALKREAEQQAAAAKAEAVRQQEAARAAAVAKAADEARKKEVALQEAKRAEAARLEALRLAAEKAAKLEADRLAAARAEEARVAAEKAEKARLAAQAAKDAQDKIAREAAASKKNDQDQAAKQAAAKADADRHEADVKAAVAKADADRHEAEAKAAAAKAAEAAREQAARDEVAKLDADRRAQEAAHLIAAQAEAARKAEAATQEKAAEAAREEKRRQDALNNQAQQKKLQQEQALAAKRKIEAQKFAAKAEADAKRALGEANTRRNAARIAKQQAAMAHSLAMNAVHTKASNSVARVPAAVAPVGASSGGCGGCTGVGF